MVLSIKNSVSSSIRQRLGESGLPCAKSGIPIAHLAVRGSPGSGLHDTAWPLDGIRREAADTRPASLQAGGSLNGVPGRPREALCRQPHRLPRTRSGGAAVRARAGVRPERILRNPRLPAASLRLAHPGPGSAPSFQLGPPSSRTRRETEVRAPDPLLGRHPRTIAADRLASPGMALNCIDGG
jgi:hypothetical protein